MFIISIVFSNLLYGGAIKGVVCVKKKKKKRIIIIIKKEKGEHFIEGKCSKRLHVAYVGPL